MQEIAESFAIDLPFLDASLYGSGHINETHLAHFGSCGEPRPYILQRINSNVFVDPPALMDNIARVTQHVRKRLEEEPQDSAPHRALEVISARNGLSYHRSPDGEYWRAYVFVSGKTVDVAESSEQAFEAAAAFAHFQKLLADLPEPALHETIPNFHDGPLRYQAFLDAVESDAHGRASASTSEIEFLGRNAGLFDVLPQEVETGNIPMRVIHNDTKINNVIFGNGAGSCVIDLDTVMPGLVHFDFGDLVRTGVSPAVEDERDLSKVIVDLKQFEAITQGYLSEAAGFLTPNERSHLVTGARLLPLMIGTRFLTDHLNGDTYFKIHRKNHNLDRCRVQFRLYELLTQQENSLARIVHECKSES